MSDAASTSCAESAVPSAEERGVASKATEGVGAAVRPVRPGPLAALFSLVVWPNWTAALLLLATLWMPHFTGCDERPVRPVAMWSEIESGDDLLHATAFSWPYFWAGLSAITLITVALLRPRRPGRALFGTTATVYLLIAFFFFAGVAISISSSISSGSPEPDTVWIWVFAPAVIAPGAWAAIAVRRGDFLSAWARLSTGLALLAVPTIMALGIFTKESRYGFNLAMLACGVLVPASWGLRWRGQSALVDRTAPSEKLRFRLAHLVVWVTFIAVVCGYYRYVSIVAE